MILSLLSLVNLKLECLQWLSSNLQAPWCTTHTHNYCVNFGTWHTYDSWANDGVDEVETCPTNGAGAVLLAWLYQLKNVGLCRTVPKLIILCDNITIIIGKLWLNSSRQSWNYMYMHQTQATPSLSMLQAETLKDWEWPGGEAWYLTCCWWGISAAWSLSSSWGDSSRWW